MAKQVHQIIIDKSFSNENIIKEYNPVVKLGIQGPSGTSFTINNGSKIQIGTYGIYELDLIGLGGQIKSLVFTDIGDAGSVIVDIVYESYSGGVAQ